MWHTITSQGTWEKKDTKYSQTCELRPPKGLGINGPITQVVSFARFGSEIFNMKLYTWPCASHQHQRSVVPTCMRGRNWQRPCARGACKCDDRSFGVPAKEKLDNQKSVFRSIWHMWSLFAGWIDALGRPPVSAIRISQVVAFQERIPYIWIRELKGLKLRVRNFQVVAFVRWSQGQVRLYWTLGNVNYHWSDNFWHDNVQDKLTKARHLELVKKGKKKRLRINSYLWKVQEPAVLRWMHHLNSPVRKKS